jgi:hypothetical protein
MKKEFMQNPTNFIARNLWATSVLVFFVLFAPLMFREWVSLRAEGLYNVQWHTTSMAKLLERDLGESFDLTEILSELKSPQTFRYFDEHVRQKLGHLGLLDVKIFDASGEVVYAIDKDLVGKIFLAGEGRKAALAGAIISELTDRHEYFAKYASDSPENMAEVLVPVKTVDGKVLYVLEAYYDYTPILQRNQQLLIKSAVSLLITTLCVLALLIYLFKSRQKMSKQVEALEAILPICMHCKKIRLERDNQPEEWMDIESFLAKQEDLSFSHGICNDCLREHYPNSKAARNIAGKS